MRGFRLSVGGDRGSGNILNEHIDGGKLAMVESYMTRGELRDMEKTVGGLGRPALYMAA